MTVMKKEPKRGQSMQWAIVLFLAVTVFALFTR